jgi:hypothetical protein
LKRIRDPGWKKVGFGINIPDPQHRISAQVVEGRTYSDNTDDACLIQCKFCLKPIALDCFTYHIKKAHSVLTQEYGEKTFLRRTYHR